MMVRLHCTGPPIMGTGGGEDPPGSEGGGGQGRTMTV